MHVHACMDAQNRACTFPPAEVWQSNQQVAKGHRLDLKALGILQLSALSILH